METIESRFLLSGYALSQVGVLGPNTTGAYPDSPLVADSSGNFYGTASGGGSGNKGTVFEIANGSNAITVLATFNGANGSSPRAGLTFDASGNLFGTTSSGGATGNGTVFEIARGSNAITTLASFNGANGAQPQGGVVLDASGNLYGTTQLGGANGDGTVFEIANASGSITTLASFDGTNGKNPSAGVTLDAAGNLLGTTYGGGTSNYGTVFEIANGTAVMTTIASFNGTNGEDPAGGITLDSSGNAYGTTYSGAGTGSNGTVFEVAAGSNTVTTLAMFNGANGAGPLGGLTFDASGNLWGTTPYGGAHGQGTVFEIATGSNAITALASFGVFGRDETAGPTFDAVGNLYGTTGGFGLFDTGMVFEIAKGSTTITTVTSFDPMGNLNPQGTLTLDVSGNLFGTTCVGGAVNDGSVFEVAHGSDAVTTLASFTGANGMGPTAGVTLDASGDLFGTTYSGGANNDGTVFEIATGSRAITTLVSFNGANGSGPHGALTFDASANLYGTTHGGGASGGGTVFEIAAGSGTLTTVASLAGNSDAGVTFDSSGNLFGTTLSGGTSGDGTVFKIARGSTFVTTLATFTGTNGSQPEGWVTFDASGNLYGTTYAGGANGSGSVFEIAQGSRTITTLVSFNGTNGAHPDAGVTLDAAGNLYGTTYVGGGIGTGGTPGTVFEIAAGSRAITTLTAFHGAGVGTQPYGGVILNASGDLFGTTTYLGEVFELSPIPTVTLALTAGSNPSTAGEPLTFTAALSGNVPDGEMVSLLDATNSNVAVATATLASGSATLTVPAGTLSVGTHNLVAAYAGDANFAASQSAAYAQTVQAAPPSLVGTPVINGDNPNGLFNAPGQTTPGQQRSMVEDVVYTFNEPVTIPNANQAFTVVLAGTVGGTLPSTLYAQAVAGSNGTQWAVSLTGQPVGTLGSIANGEYGIAINPGYVFAAADGVTSMAPGTGRRDMFYRLYGDVFGTRNVTALDYSRFKSSLTTYNSMFDNYNTGNITALDYALFKKDLSIDYSSDGFVTTI